MKKTFFDFCLSQRLIYAKESLTETASESVYDAIYHQRGRRRRSWTCSTM